MAELAELREKSEALRRKLGSALIYPSILFVVALGSLVLLLTVVVPRFAPLFASIGESLPWNTRLVMAISERLQADGPILLSVLLVLILALGQILRMEGPRRAIDRLVFRLPLIGRAVRERITAQLARGLSSLLEGGLDLPGALLLARDMLGNRHAAKALDEVVSQIRQGRLLATALARADLLAPAGLRMLRVGEESGRLKEVARHVADAFEERAATRLTRLVALAEPITIVVMGLLVGAIVMSILNAVMSVYDVAR
jgi:general secretion pathway protein F